MAIELLQTVTKAENSSGDIGVYTIKVKEGYAMVQNPDVLTIGGDEWDLTGDNTPISITTGTDHREVDGNGNGIHGTQTFNINLEYAAGNLNPSDDNTNEITLNLHVEKIKFLCANTSEYIVMRGGVPSFNFFEPITNYSATTFYGSDPLYLALAQQTYAWFIDNENDAFCLHTSGTGLSMTGQYSKTVSVSTSVYTGTKTIYWGDITVTCSGDFGTASMIFDDGLRSTKDWIRYEESCVVLYTSASTAEREDNDLLNVIKIDDCEYLGTGATTTYQEVLHSKTNGYNFALKYQFDNPLTYSFSKKENNIYLSVVQDGQIGQGTLARSTDGVNFQICQFNPTDSQLVATFGHNQSLAAFRRQTYIEDFCYAGVDSSGNHVWYALCMLNDSQNISGPLASAENKLFLAKSIDNAVSFSILNFDETKTGNADFFGELSVSRGTGSGTATTLHRFGSVRIYASIEYDYLFIYRGVGARYIDQNGVPQYTSVLYRYFPSQDNNTTSDDCVIKPIVAGRFSQGSPEKTGVDSFETYYIELDVDNKSVPFLVLNNGLCVFTGMGQYAISWNYGINWTVADLPTISDTHTNGSTYVYPEDSPSPYEQNGNVYFVTGTYNDSFQRNTPYRQGVVNGSHTLSFGLFNSFMRMNIKGENTNLGGTVPTSWTDATDYNTITTKVVTVQTYTPSPSNNIFVIDGTSSFNQQISAPKGSVIRFDQSDTSNTGKQILFSTESASGLQYANQYTTEVTVNGTPGTSGAFTDIRMPGSVTIYFFHNTGSGTTHTYGHTLNGSYSVNVSDIIEDWTLLKDYDYSSSKLIKRVSDIFVDEEENRVFISHGQSVQDSEFGVTIIPSPPSPTISNTGIFTTITTPTLPSGTTLTQASANQGYYYEVYSDDPFSIVFTTGNGDQRKFDGVFDIVVLSKTLPVVLDTVSNQQYTTYQGIFDMGDAPTSLVPNPANNGTLVSGSFGTSGLTQLGHYIVRDAFLYYGFIPKVYVNGFWRSDPEGSNANAATNLKTYSRVELTVGDRPRQVASGQSIEYLFDPANGPILTTPSNYNFTHILGMYSGGTTLGTGNSHYRSINGSLPLYGDVIFCFPKRNSDGYTVPTFFNGNVSSNIFTNSGDINTIGLKFYSDYTSTEFISGYYGSRTTEQASIYRRINPDSSVQLDFADKYNKNYIHINSDGFVDEVGDVASLPNYDQCN
jgi:hypothetical protein